MSALGESGIYLAPGLGSVVSIPPFVVPRLVGVGVVPPRFFLLLPAVPVPVEVVAGQVVPFGSPAPLGLPVPAILRLRLPPPVPVVLLLWHSLLAEVGPVEVVGALLPRLLGRLLEIFGVVVVHVLLLGCIPRIRPLAWTGLHPFAAGQIVVPL